MHTDLTDNLHHKKEKQDILNVMVLLLDGFLTHINIGTIGNDSNIVDVENEVSTAVLYMVRIL